MFDSLRSNAFDHLCWKKTKCKTLAVSSSIEMISGCLSIVRLVLKWMWQTTASVRMIPPSLHFYLFVLFRRLLDVFDSLRFDVF